MYLFSWSYLGLIAMFGGDGTKEQVTGWTETRRKQVGRYMGCGER